MSTHHQPLEEEGPTQADQERVLVEELIARLRHLLKIVQFSEVREVMVLLIVGETV